jgi:hypothetical protein
MLIFLRIESKNGIIICRPAPKVSFMQWMPPDSVESAKGIKDIDKIKRFLLDYYFLN